MLVKAKAAGQVGRGRRWPKNNSRDARELSRVRLRDAGVDHKLSASAQKLAAVPHRRFAAMVAENPRENSPMASPDRPPRRRVMRAPAAGHAMGSIRDELNPQRPGDGDTRLNRWSMSNDLNRRRNL
jgi:hypothetical protein